MLLAAAMVTPAEAIVTPAEVKWQQNTSSTSHNVQHCKISHADMRQPAAAAAETALLPACTLLATCMAT
jgi:hypothetical protein